MWWQTGNREGKAQKEQFYDVVEQGKKWNHRAYKRDNLTEGGIFIRPSFFSFLTLEP